MERKIVWKAFLFQSRIFGILIDSEAFPALTGEKGISVMFSPVNSIHGVVYFHTQAYNSALICGPVWAWKRAVNTNKDVRESMVLQSVEEALGFTFIEVPPCPFED